MPSCHDYITTVVVMHKARSDDITNRSVNDAAQI